MDIEFKMPACTKHLLKGHKWWCRKCDIETEKQFREVCQAWWNTEEWNKYSQE